MADPIQPMAVDYDRLEDSIGLNYWEYDPVFREEVSRLYDTADLEDATARLETLGEIVGETIVPNATTVDENGPELSTHDRDGTVVNEVEYHPAHLENERLAFEHGCVADSFRAPPGREEPLPLVHSLAASYMLSYADGGLVCIVSMAAGAAVVLEDHLEDERLATYHDAFTKREYDELQQAAMFMTERQGGSDVGTNETTATETEEAGVYELTGEKWFCSNIDADAALTLARRPDAPDGVSGLSLFVLPRRKRNGELNDMVYRRLKDKLGTISVPTGEIELDGAEAYLIGEPEEGFEYMTDMLNYERITNAVGSAAGIGHNLLRCKIHTASREAFGKRLRDHPLMRADLVEMAVRHEAATVFSFAAARALDEYQQTGSDSAFRRMRILASVAKYRTARMSIETASYAMEVRGGDGYVRGFGHHRAVRDAHVASIWEGTSNVLSLDILRAMYRNAAHEPVLADIEEFLSVPEHPVLCELVEEVDAAREGLVESLGTIATEDPEYAQLYAKRVADYIFDVYTAALLCVRAQEAIDEEGDARRAIVAERFVDTHLREHEHRNIPSGDRVPLEHFEAIVDFEPMAPSKLADEPPATAED